MAGELIGISVWIYWTEKYRFDAKTQFGTPESHPCNE
jgi:hypothetical protein